MMRLIVAASLFALLPSFVSGIPALAQQIGSLPEQSAHHIEYPSPQAAMAALSIKPGVSMRVVNGWVIADDTATKVLWSFPPKESPAAPAVVKRLIYVDANDVKIQMDVMCGGTKVACDQLVVGFQQLNARLHEQATHMPGYVPPALAH
jgi:hypothetical protein